MAKKVKSISHLKRLATNKRGYPQYFYLAITEGIPCASKHILFDPKTNCFFVINEKDPSKKETFTPEQLKETTHIVDAIEDGTFYKY